MRKLSIIKVGKSLESKKGDNVYFLINAVFKFFDIRVYGWESAMTRFRTLQVMYMISYIQLLLHTDTVQTIFKLLYCDLFCFCFAF